MGTNAIASAVPPRLGGSPRRFKTKARREATGKIASSGQASLTRFGYGGHQATLIPFALITVATPARATTLRVRPAALRPIQRRRADRLSPRPALCTAVSALTRPLHSLCNCAIVGASYKGKRDGCQGFRPRLAAFGVGGVRSWLLGYLVAWLPGCLVAWAFGDPLPGQ